MANEYPVPSSNAETTAIATSNGQTAFSFDWRADSADQVHVIYRPTGAPERILVLGSDFSVQGLQNPSGGSILLVGFSANKDDVIYMFRETLIEREKKWQNEGDYKADLVNREQDDIYMIMQENRRDLRSNASSIAIERAARISGDEALSTRIDDMQSVVDEAAQRAENAADASAGSASISSDAADRAEAAAAGLNLPPILPGDKGKSLVVNSAEDGYYLDRIEAEGLIFDSKIDAEAAFVAVDVNSIQISGYYSAGDGGQSLYKKVATEPSHQGKIKTSDGAWWELANGVINVKMLGARGDASVDDTAAIQAAIEVAESRVRLSYWSGYVPSVYVPSGSYSITGLDINLPIKFFGDSSQAVSFGLRPGSNRSAIVIYAIPEDFPSTDSYRVSAELSGFSITGSSASQTTGNGISLPDSPRSLSQQYDGSVNMSDIVVRDMKGHSFFAGNNRNHGHMINCKGLYALGSNLQIMGYDWRITDCDFGHAGINNISFSSGGAHSVKGTYCYIAASNSVQIGYGVNASCTFFGCYIEGSEQNGLYIDGPSSNSIKHVFVGNNFRDNSKGNNGVYSHIHLKGQIGTVLQDNTFTQLSDPSINGRPKYIISLEDSDKIVWSGSYSTVAGNDRPYTDANFCNEDFKLMVVGDGNISLRQWGNSTFRLQGERPKFNLWDEAMPANQRNWQLSSDNGFLQINANDDSNGTLVPLIQLSRSGAIELYIDVLSGRRKIEVGAADSGDTGYRILRVKEFP